MTNVLYIGNHLKTQQTNISAISVLGPLLETAGYTVFYASSKPNKLLRMWAMLYSVCRYAKGVDVVLIDTYSTTNFYYALLVSQLCRLLRLPYIPILHGGELPKRLERSPFWSRLIFKHAQRLVSPSKYLEEAFDKPAYAPVVFIPNSLSIDQYRYERKTYRSIRLLWVRSFSNIYNPSLAVRVLKRLQDAGYACELCMVGPDTGDGSLQAAQQLAADLAVSVRFTGKLPKADWLALAHDYNVFINTTHFDNMPVSVIEAMALGLPVVSTDVGGLPYLITHEETGLLVGPDDADAFETAIVQLVSDTNGARAMTERARAMVEGFDWEVVKEKWFAILR